MVLFENPKLKLIILIVACDLIVRSAGTTTVSSFEKSLAFPNYEICNRYNGRRIYVDLGEQGVVKATNITVPLTTNVRLTLLSISKRIDLFSCYQF